LPSRIIKGGIVQPIALAHSITVDHMRLPGYVVVARPTESAEPATFEEELVTRPIAKPVLLKLYVSSSRIPYFYFIARTRSN
jgi:hypothetical protein